MDGVLDDQRARVWKMLLIWGQLPAMMLAPGTTIGLYFIERESGRSEMEIVYCISAFVSPQPRRPREGEDLIYHSP